LRVVLLRLAAREHVLLVTCHHVASDARSIEVLLDELAALYGAAAGRPALLPELPLQYADYAVWQRARLAAGDLADDLAYWRERLHALPVLALSFFPSVRPRPASLSGRDAGERVSLARGTADDARTLARGTGATLFMVLLAAWQAMLWRFSGRHDLALGTAVANRNRPETQNLIGFFVNMLVLHTEVEPRRSFRDLVDRARSTVLAAFAHREAPFKRVIEEAGAGQDLSRRPLVQATLTLQLDDDRKPTPPVCTAKESSANNYLTPLAAGCL
jgi:hypothetical protein